MTWKLGPMKQKTWSLVALENFPQYNASKPILQAVGWLPLLKKFRGNDDDVAMEFT